MDNAAYILNGATPCAIKHVAIDTATAGNNAIVAAVSDKIIKVLSLAIVASGPVDVYWNDGTDNLFGGTRKIPMDVIGTAGTVGFFLPHNTAGWFQTGAVNRALNLNLSGAVGVCGCFTYALV
jgi:hypothetical protein